MTMPQDAVQEVDGALNAFSRSREFGALAALSERHLFVITSLFFIAPSALFAPELKPIPALIVVAGCLVAAIVVLTQKPPQSADDPLSAPVDFKRLSLCIAIAAVALVLGGALHFSRPPTDWYIRDAVLADLSQKSFPILYKVGSTDYLLRAPLALYMFPSWIGRSFGLYAGHVALWLQDGVLFGVMLYFFGSLGRGWPHTLVILCYGSVAVTVTGLLVLAPIDAEGKEVIEGAITTLRSYIRPWGALHQYYWVPNHAIPAWWLATLLLLQTRGAVDNSTLAVSIAAAVFWSPLAVIAPMLWLGLCVARDFRHAVADRRLWLAAIACASFMPLAIYMVLHADSIAHGVASAPPKLQAVPWLAIPTFAQILYIAFNYRSVPRPLIPMLALSVALLFVLPLFHFGPNNDLVSRGSIVPMVLTAFAFGWILLSPDLGRVARYSGWALAGAALASPLFEFVQAFGERAYPIRDCSVMEAANAIDPKGFPANYLVEVDRVPTWLVRTEGLPAKVDRPGGCIPE